MSLIVWAPTIPFEGGVWNPNWKTIGPNVFIEISKWDRKFCRYISGKTLAFKEGGPNVDINAAFFDTLRARRNQASQEAYRAATDTEESPEKKRRKARKGDSSLAPPSVYVSAPPISHEGVVYALPNDEMEVAWGVGADVKLWVKCGDDTILYVKAAILSDLSQNVRGRNNTRVREEDGDNEENVVPANSEGLSP